MADGRNEIGFGLAHVGTAEFAVRHLVKDQDPACGFHCGRESLLFLYFTAVKAGAREIGGENHTYRIGSPSMAIACGYSFERVPGRTKDVAVTASMAFGFFM